MKVQNMTEDDPSTDELVPIPVQIFLWRQSSPFVRPRLGKVHDAACMVSRLLTLHTTKSSYTITRL